MKLRKDQSLLIWASVASLALWFVPYLKFLVQPFWYYKTHVHEICHALVGIATGGKVEYIILHAEGGGLTQTIGGLHFWTTSAGYIGTTVVGGILLLGSRTVRGATVMLWLGAAFLTLSTVLYVRGDAIGIAISIAWIAALSAAAIWLKDDTKVFAVQFLGVQQCLTAASSIFLLLDLVTFNTGHNDATILAEMTNVPAMVWAVLWMLIGLIVIVLGIWAAWRSKPRSQSPKRTGQI